MRHSETRMDFYVIFGLGQAEPCNKKRKQTPRPVDASWFSNVKQGVATCLFYLPGLRSMLPYFGYPCFAESLIIVVMNYSALSHHSEAISSLFQVPVFKRTGDF